MSQRVAEGEVLLLRPLFARVAGTAYWSSALAVFPPFLALYALTWRTDGWQTVLIANVIVAGALYIGITRVRGTSITFTDDAVIEHGYLGATTRTPRSEIVAIRVVQVYSRRSLETNANVFFLDAEGRTRLRIRGPFWGAKSTASAIAAFDLPVERLPEPIPRSEMRHLYRPNLYLYERHPSITYLVSGTVLLLVSTPLIAALNSVL